MPLHLGKTDGLKKRLDRVLFNNSWIDCFPKNVISHGILKESGHRPILLVASKDFVLNKGFFQFQNMWTLHPFFLAEVEANWNIPARNKGLKKIKEKLFRLKQLLIFWKKKHFGNIFLKMKILEKEVALAEVQMVNSPSLVNSQILKD